MLSPMPAAKARRPPLPQLFTAMCVALVLMAGGVWFARAQQPSPAGAGRIEGNDIVVRGAVATDVAGGLSTTLLSNGSEVTVRSGQARITLEGGGELGVCGPAQFTVLKSGSALTLALQYGRVHGRLDAATTLTVYTALVVVTPISISGGPRDFAVGLDPSGKACVNAARGATRVEQQFTGENFIVPQGGELALVEGRLAPSGQFEGGCVCEILAARREAPAVEFAERAPKRAVFRLPAAQPPRRLEDKETKTTAARLGTSNGGEAPRLPDAAEPIYEVLMPPLTFNAASPEAPPDPRPETILLVRRVRVRPAVIYQGTVEAAAPPPAPAPAPPAQASAPTAVSPVTAKTEPAKQPGVLDRIRSFFRRLTSR